MVGIWDWIFFMAEHVNMWVSHNLLGLVSCCMYSCSYRKNHQNAITSFSQLCRLLQCTMCCLCSLSSSQPNKLRHILKFVSWYPIQHIFVPACSIARNSYKKMFLWTSNSKSVIFPKMYPSVQWTLGYIFGMLTVYPTWATKYTPVSHIGGILDTGVHDCPMYTLCTGAR